MQCITTKYHGPTEHKGSRISARVEHKRATYSWDYSLGVSANHQLAALKLAKLLGWINDYVEPELALGRSGFFRQLTIRPTNLRLVTGFDYAGNGQHTLVIREQS